MKSSLRNQFSVRLDQAAYKTIQTSGQKPADWLRQAVEWRIENERQAISALATLEKRIGKLEQQGTENQQGILKLQQSDAITQATQSEMRKILTQIQKNQVNFHEMLATIDQSFGESLEQLGQSLLNALGPQLRERVKVQEEPPRRIIPPAPPRTRL
ncbi:MAG: hypothetical protein IPL99_08865 [Candidatus Competibacteraceae bacterium]|nr:hypothetical protein [Candidatus Competibacteraceae bacterium]